MPYIAKAERDYIAAGNPPTTVGELNYCITALIMSYARAGTMSYLVINDVLGAMKGAELEFYRRVAVPYEEAKREANGDVYDAAD